MGVKVPQVQRGRSGAPDWPLGDDGRPVLPGDTVKMAGGSVVFVLSVTFASTPGAYVNGFWVGPDERLRVVRRGMA